MKPKEKWISLKEAAEISGYSPDYVGQLIRKGKIPGKQVYYNIAWTTRAESILEYKERENKRKEAKTTFKDKFLDFLKDSKQKFFLEIRIFKLFIKTFKYVLPIVIILILSFSMLLFYIFLISLGRQEPKSLPEIVPGEIKQESRELKY